MRRPKWKKWSGYRQHSQFNRVASAPGFKWKNTDILKTCLMIYLAVLAAGYLYKLKFIYELMLLAAGTFCIPYHIFYSRQNQYDQNIFKTRLEYMEQMLSSFKRRPKMLSALKDTLTIFSKEGKNSDRKMREAIEKAMEVIRMGDAGGERSIYRNAAARIEKSYGCHRLVTMHNYMENVELQGGEYKRAADILMQEHRLWKTNMESLKKEQRTKRTGVYVVTAACLGICAFPAYLDTLLPGYTKHLLYQLGSTIFLAAVLFFLIFAERRLNGWWSFDPKEQEEERVYQNYKSWKSYDMKKQKKKALLYAAIPYGIAAACILFHNYVFAGLGIMYGICTQRFAVSRWKGLRKSVVKALECRYPQWMMEMTLLLQTENVYVSLKHSAEHAPRIIREEIQILAERLENEPNSVEPYHDFFGDLELDSIAASMRNLYSVSSLGVQEETALLQLVEHNNTLMNKAEELKGKERLNLWTAYMYLPMLAGGTKIIADTLLLCASMITSAIQSV